MGEAAGRRDVQEEEEEGVDCGGEVGGAIKAQVERSFRLLAS
jgi:hypothetical protein